MDCLIDFYSPVPTICLSTTEMVFERINFFLQDVYTKREQNPAYNPSEALPPQVHLCFRGTVVVLFCFVFFLITGRLLVDNNILES